jgi:hypothetical protein
LVICNTNNWTHTSNSCIYTTTTIKKKDAIQQTHLFKLYYTYVTHTLM